MFFVIKMQQKLVFVVVGSVCVFFSYCLALRDVVFVQKPQNLTIFNLKEPFFFNCSTDVASTEGMDWRVRIGESLERICFSKKFDLTGDNSCQLNYSMEVPNNRTLNLIVDPRIATLGDKYCCQFDNGAGNQSCSYLTISLATDPAFTDSTTVFSHKNTTASEGPPANGKNQTTVAIIVAVILVVVIIIIAAIVGFFIWHRKKRYLSVSRGNNTIT